jgi:hypothetical protein
LVEGPDGIRRTKARLLTDLERRLARSARGPGELAVVMSHLGELSGGDGRITGRDLAETPGVDLVIDGHSHRGRGPERIGRAWYLNCGDGLTAVVEAVISRGRLSPPRLLTYDDLADVRPDPELEVEIGDLSRRLRLDEPLIELPSRLDFSRRRPEGEAEDDDLGRAEEGVALGRLVCRAMNAAAGSEMAFLNRGALRSGLSGSVTAGDVHEALPFGDDLLSADYSGEEIAALFDRFGRKGRRGLPFFVGVSVYGFEKDDGGLATAGLTDDRGRDASVGGPRRLAFSGQMAAMLGELGPVPGRPGRRRNGTLVEAVTRGLTAMSRDEIASVGDQPLALIFEDAATARAAWLSGLGT